MRIFQIIFSLASGGAERVVVNLSNELAKEHEVTIICIQKIRGNNSFYLKQLNENIEVVSLDANKGINLKSFVKIFQLIIWHNPNIIHAHLNTLVYCFLPSLFFKKIKFFHTLHSIADKSVGFKHQKILNRWFYRQHFIRPIAISAECAISFQQFYGLGNISIIPNAVPYPTKSLAFESVKEEVQRYRLDEKSIIFTHLARFSNPKNQNMLVEVFNDLLDQGHPVKLLIIGNGFESCKAILLKRKAKNGIYFLGEKTNPIDYLMNSDCFVLSSEYEGLPMSLLEAFSCGIPAVCTPAGGIPDVLNKDFLGIISTNFTKRSYKHAVEQFITRKDNFDKTKITQYYKENFSIRNSANAHIDKFSQ